MTAPVRPSLTRRTSKSFQKKNGTKLYRRLPARAALIVLFLGLTVGAYALAAKPVSSAAAHGKHAVAQPSWAAPTRAAANLSAAGAAAPLSSFKPLLPAAALFLDPTLEVYEAPGCTTPKTSFNLGDAVCVKVDDADVGVTGSPRNRIVLGHPGGFITDAIDVTTSSQTVTFTLPSSATSAGFDNRGTWIVGLVETSNATLTRAVPITVHDTAQAVADLTITKRDISSSAPTAGSNITYQVYIWNRGPDAATNVQFADNTLPNTTFVSLTQTSGPTFTCTTPAVGASGVSTCKLGTTAAPQTFAKGDAAAFTAVYHVNTSVADGADLTDTVGVASETYDSQLSTNSSTVDTTASNPAPPPCTVSCPSNITVNAPQGQSGATVAFDPPTLGGTCGPVTTTPASGSFFGIGTTVVTSSTAEGYSCSFLVTVNAAVDTQAPSISCPLSDISVNESSPAANSAVVNYSVTATDDSGTAIINCDPPSGSTFPAGTTPVRCTATDPSGNISECSFNVTVNQSGCAPDANSAAPVPDAASLPTITRSCSVTLLATDDPTATDVCGSRIIGSTPDRIYDAPGTYTVVWTYTDSAGHTTTQNQTVVILPDNSAPVPDAATLPTVTGECSAAITDDPPTATDNCGGSGIVGVALDPLSYSTVGTHVVRWRYSDNAGNSTIQNQTVIVTDTHAPVVTLTGPSSVTVECHTSYTDAGATATDNCSPAPAPTSNSNVDVNAPGTYTVVWSATDGGNNTATATRTVTVVDTIKPVITLNGASALTVECHTSFTDPGATASDSCDSSVPVNVSGSVNVNAVGVYTLTYNASDDSNNAADPVTRTVTVVDTTAPVITTNGLTPSLWPANHKYKTFNVTDFVTAATDSCNTSLGVSSVVIEKVTSDEVENGNGDGNTSNDIVIDANCKSFQLRAEREGGGNGRVYTITFKVTDASGNVGRTTALVVVPHNPGEAPVNSGVHYTVNGSCP